MTVQPDVAGFAEAQGRLRGFLGVDAVFIIAGEPTWPEGTAIDPETGRPYDPFLEPEQATADQQITVRASFASWPVQGEDPTQAPIGNADRGSATLIVGQPEYELVKDAQRVQVAGETWDVQMWRADVVGGMGRWLAYLEHA